MLFSVQAVSKQNSDLNKAQSGYTQTSLIREDTLSSTVEINDFRWLASPAEEKQWTIE